jgi:hypothetical protein
VTVASSGGGGTQLHTTTTKSYNPETLQCLVCVGSREGHHILDNHDGRGITIMLGDQHLPSVVATESPNCVVSMRYSNCTMTDLYEYLALPALKSFAKFDSKERAGFTDVFQTALAYRLEIKLIVASGTSWLSDGPAGYTESMQVWHDWSQAHVFAMVDRGEKGKSLVRCILFPQPMLPYIKPAVDAGNERKMLQQHSFEATNVARMLVGANCHKSVNTVQSETDLIGLESLERSVDDNFFDVVPYSFRANLKNTSNPAHDRMPVKLRLTGHSSWPTSDRSDDRQCLTVKFLTEWCEAILADLQVFGGGYSRDPEELLRARATLPNILVAEGSWDAQVEVERKKLGMLNAFCIHQTAHADTHMDTAVAIAEHKLTCFEQVI